jgi:hypothetical protein
VDVEAGERAVDLMRGHVARASRPEVVGSLGGFAGLFALDTTRYRRPLLASSTDGVGTKIALARALDVHDTVGIDLVAMVVDDLVVCGAEPLFLLDYIACGSVDPERIARLVSGIATGCEQSGCALVGGETAEHPGLMGADDYDLAATGVGVVEADEVLGAELVRPGDVLIAMASSGVHSNGFSLVRHILFGPADQAHPGGVGPAGLAVLDRHEPTLGATLGGGPARQRCRRPAPGRRPTRRTRPPRSAPPGRPARARPPRGAPPRARSRARSRRIRRPAPTRRRGAAAPRSSPPARHRRSPRGSPCRTASATRWPGP